MPSGAEKWVHFLQNFNKLIDLKTIKEERIKQLDWVDGVVKSVQNNFKGNPIALRLNLQDLLKTNVTLTKSIDESKLVNASDVNTELRDLSTELRTHYRKTIETALSEIRDQSTSIMTKITALVYQLSDAALFHVSTQGISTRFLGAERDNSEVLLGVALTGPILSGNTGALEAWVNKVYAGLRAVLAHFLAGKSFSEKIFAEYASAIELAGLSFTSPPVVALLAEVRLAAAVAPVSLDEIVVSFQLSAFDDKFFKQYAVRVALELCGRFEPRKLLQGEGAVLVEISPATATLWESEVTTTADPETPLELGEDESCPTQRIRLKQIFPPPPPTWQEIEAEAQAAYEASGGEGLRPGSIYRAPPPKPPKRGSVTEM